MLNNNLIDSPETTRLKLKISQFIEYDKKRKEYVKSLEEKLEYTLQLLDDANDELTELTTTDDVDDYVIKLQTKVKNQRAEINRLSGRAINPEIELDVRVAQLNGQIKSLVKERNKFRKLYQTALKEISGLVAKQLHGNDADVVAIVKRLIDNSNNIINE